MNKLKTEWYSQWFNRDYLNLYEYRDQKEAKVQVEFLVKHLQLSGRERVLDLGCGTGRHAFELAQRGMTLVGLDYSAVLIEEAQKNQKEHPELALKFILADMRQPVKLLGTFDLVICMFTSFGYFPEDKDNFSVLSNVRTVLSLGGKYFLDYLNPTFVEKKLDPYEERVVNGERVEIHRKIEDDSIVKTIVFPGRTYEERVKLYCRETLQQMLEANRLQVIHSWSGYDGAPWSEDGERQLFYCKAV